MSGSILNDRLVELALTAGKDFRTIHARIDGSLATAEKTNLAAAISELSNRVPVNIAVGATPPTSPSINDLWIDTN